MRLRERLARVEQAVERRDRPPGYVVRWHEDVDVEIVDEPPGRAGAQAPEIRLRWTDDENRPVNGADAGTRPAAAEG